MATVAQASAAGVNSPTAVLARRVGE